MNKRLLLALTLTSPIIAFSSSTDTKFRTIIQTSNQSQLEMVLQIADKNTSLTFVETNLPEQTISIETNESETNLLIELLKSQLGPDVTIEKVSISDVSHATQDGSRR